MSNDYPGMLETARRYRDKKLCPDCKRLQQEVDRLRELIRQTESSQDAKEFQPPVVASVKSA